MKRKLSIILSLSLFIYTIGFSYNVKAYETNGFWRDTADFIKSLVEVGTVMKVPNYPTLEEYYEDWKQSNNIQDAPSHPTEQEFIQYMNTGVIVNGDNITYQGNTWNFMKYLDNEYRKDNQYLIAYSWDFTSKYSTWPTANNDIAARIKQKQGIGNVFVQGGLLHVIWTKQRTKSNYIGIYDIANSQGDFGTAKLYDFVNNSYSDIILDHFNVWTPDTVDTVTWSNQSFIFSKVPNTSFTGNNNTPAFASANNNQDSMYIYYNVSNLPTNPNIPNYFTKDSHDTNITGDTYNTTKSNIDNSVNYNDVYNYITNNYDYTTNTYPSPTNINNYINSFNENNNTNNNGGSGTTTDVSSNGINIVINNNPNISNTNDPSFNNTFNPTLSNNNINNNYGLGGLLSGNTVSGNGSSVGGTGNIFGFLGYIGNLIGDLISGLGQTLVGILEGVSEAVQVVVEGIPNVLSPLLGFVFEGLPEEIRSLMTLGISAVLLIAVIKAIRK